VKEEGDVVSIRGAMRELLEQEGIEGLGRLLRIREAWEGLVGERAARESRPYRIEGDRLYVGVNSHAWAQELHYRIEEVKAGIRAKTGLEISEIIIRKINLQ